MLRRIYLAVPQGEFVSLVGSAGAGKSTLLSILGLFDSHWSGEYEFAGRSARDLTHSERQAIVRDHIGMIFQDRHLFCDLTVAENIEMALNYHKMRRAEKRDRVADILAQLDLQNNEHVYAEDLPENVQQLVAIGRAVVKRPKLILADEPVQSLNDSEKKSVGFLFQRLNARGITIIWATRYACDSGRFTRTLRLSDGWLSE